MASTPLILKLDKAGNPLKWIGHEAAIRLYANDRVITELGSKQFLFLGGINAISGERSAIEVGSILLTKSAVKAVQSSHDYVPCLTNRALFRRDKHLCLYCGDEFKESELTRDHVVPISRGGKDSWANVASACKRCNNHKADKMPEEADMPLLAVPYVPNYAEWLILHNRRILSDQVEFLKSRCPKNSRLWD